MIAILIDPSFLNGVWCTHMLKGLTSCLKQKRLAFCEVKDINTLCDYERYVFVIGADTHWVKSALERVNALGKYPILLCNQAQHKFECDYSTVCSDVAASMRYVFEHFSQVAHSRIALYGVNPQSISDLSRMDSFIAAGGDAADSVFYNRGSMKNCYASFMAHEDSFDVVVCTNCFVAVSLVRRLRRDDPQRLKRLTIVGYQEIRLTELYAGDICTLYLNSLEYGRAAVMLMESLQKNAFISHIVMAVKWDMRRLGKAGEMKQRAFCCPELAPSLDPFYDDPEIHEMMLMESLLCSSELLDKQIVQHLLEGLSYEVIADKCFLSISAVKYRIRRMAKACGMNNRSDLLALLHRYVIIGSNDES